MNPLFFHCALLVHALLVRQGACGVRFSEAITNDVNSDFTKSSNLIPDSLVGPEKVSATDVPGQPLNPTDFVRGELIQIVNAPQINGDDPIMAAQKFQGDIEIHNSDLLESLNSNALSMNPPQKNAIINDSSKWKHGVVPYAISAAYDSNERATIAKAMAAFHSKTCIRFVPRNVESDYIYIQKGSGCSSAVGRTGGRQSVTLGNGCLYYGIVIHELMHATGFWHEQSREDRDSYVTIIWNNIISGMDYNFDKYGSDIIQDLGVTYDTGSIMHYGPYSFAKDRSKPTIISNTGLEIGQRSHLSKKDVKKLNALYQCDATAAVTPPPPEPVSTVCTDSSEFCAHWNKIGECDNNPAWMHNNCKKSCNKCKKDCKNDNSECENWAKQNYCQKSAGYMTKHCKLACGTCGSKTTPRPETCEDINQFCSAWAATGECRANPSYMLPNCKKSCKQC